MSNSKLIHSPQISKFLENVPGSLAGSLFQSLDDFQRGKKSRGSLRAVTGGRERNFVITGKGMHLTCDWRHLQRVKQEERNYVLEAILTSTFVLNRNLFENQGKGNKHQLISSIWFPVLPLLKLQGWWIIFWESSDVIPLWESPRLKSRTLSQTDKLMDSLAVPS